MEFRLNNTLSKRFITGLEKYNIPYETIKNDWYYIGGEKGVHLNYFNKYYSDEDLPEHKDYCICGHKIKNNCFISDGEYVLSIGESCVNKFVPKCDKICEECGIHHRNRKDNKCKNCRKKFKRVFGDYIISFI